eukprot:SAG31_NODE_33884_length_339_cov_0.650000_1_plen_49_part_01
MLIRPPAARARCSCELGACWRALDALRSASYSRYGLRSGPAGAGMPLYP